MVVWESAQGLAWAQGLVSAQGLAWVSVLVFLEDHFGRSSPSKSQASWDPSEANKRTPSLNSQHGWSRCLLPLAFLGSGTCPVPEGIQVGHGSGPCDRG